MGDGRRAMSDSLQNSGEPVATREHRRLYAGVIAVEALVLLAIWTIQHYFGS